MTLAEIQAASDVYGKKHPGKRVNLKRKYAAGIEIGPGFYKASSTEKAKRLHRANREAGKTVFGTIAGYLPGWLYK